MKKCRKLLSVLLAVLLLAGTFPAARAEQTYATRGQVADMLIAAADDYNPGVQRSDVIKGYGSGDLDENGAVTRAQALVMLSRAFGTLPTPVGDNARSGYSAANFTDIPDWAKTELSNVFNAGIVAGTSATTFSPDANVTLEQMSLFISRVFALEGSNVRDDFYATVNKQALDTSVIDPGSADTSSFTDLQSKVDEELSATVKSIVSAPKTDGEKKMATLYSNITNKTARNQAGITPIRDYVTAIENAQSLAELMKVRNRVYDDLGAALLVGFGLTIDAKNSSKYALAFTSIKPTLAQSSYTAATDEQKAAYLTYLKSLFTLLGESESDAAAQARLIWNTEASIANASLTTQEGADVSKTYNVYTLDQLQQLFPNADIGGVFRHAGFKQTSTIVVTDVGALKAAAASFDDAHLAALKAIALSELAGGFGEYLNEDFTAATEQFQNAYAGTSGSVSEDQKVLAQIEKLMPDYLSEAYVSRYSSAAAKTEVESMAKTIIATYRERINALTWMSAATKATALKKIENMTINIGYPDEWGDMLAGVKFRSVAEGGSFFENAVTVLQLSRLYQVLLQNRPVDKTMWAVEPYEVNAGYVPTLNSINFPAAILQAPFYDANASYEQNLGRIGFVIGHEITHAFDNNGAKYDENGNSADWWTDSDYAAFQTLCDKVVALYDGRESAPGITCDGALTVSENIADLGSVACITQIESRRSSPDFKALYTAESEIWYASYPRAYRQLLARLDVHAPSKLRGSVTLQQFQQFYDAFGIKAGDGMWLAPEKRVTIW